MIPNRNYPEFLKKSAEVHFRISPEFLKTLDDYSVSMGMRRAEFIQYALLFYMGSLSTPPREE